MKILMHEPLPRWYGLSWSNKEPAILVRIHRDLLERLEPIKDDTPVVLGLSQITGFTTFVGDFTDDFGFNRALVRQDDKSKYVTFRGELPKIRYPTTKRCGDCRGTKKDRLVHGNSCYNCDGTGKEHDYKWQRANELSASFSLLLEAMEEYIDDDFATAANKQQLLTVNLFVQQQCAPINGMYSISLAEWLRTRTVGEPITKMTEAMRRAYGHMLGESRTDPFYFRASVDSPTGWLNVSVPGDGCGIHPSNGESPKVARGYKFSDHNTDHPAQQLALLAGLAALHDLVDQNLP